MSATEQSRCQVDAVVSGDAMEMGIAQGSQLRGKIQHARNVLEQLEAFRLMKPGWLPFTVFRKLCESKAARHLERGFARDFPEAQRRLKGISAGSGVGIGSLYLFAAIESMLSEKAGCARPAFGACSALAVRRSRSATGEPVIVRNFDYLQLVQPLYAMRKSQPRGGFQSLDFTMA